MTDGSDIPLLCDAATSDDITSVGRCATGVVRIMTSVSNEMNCCR